MKHISFRNSTASVIITLICIALISATSAGADDLLHVSKQAITEVTPVSLQQVVMAIWRGEFTRANELILQVEPDSANGQEIAAVSRLLQEYNALMQTCDTARQEAYDEYIQDMHKSLNTANWREYLLTASQEYPLDTEVKTDLEQELQDELDDDWIAAMAQLTAAHSLAERMELDQSIDPQIQSEVVSRILQIGDQLEDQQKWLEAYGNVYYYLAALASRSNDYDDHMDYLLRQATTSTMYVNDPNEDGVTWQERREGITRDIFYAGLRLAEEYFVEEPDYRKMAELGLRNCQVMADTDRLVETFPNLENADLLDAYRTHLTELKNRVMNRQDQFTKRDLLDSFQGALRINEDSLAFPENVIIAEFAEGAFSALDSYTYLVWPGEVADFRKDMTNEFSGVGIVINMLNGRLTVDSLLEDSPAMRAGLDAGDIIAAVDGESTARITLEMAVRRITGPRGTNVVLTIERQGVDDTIDYTITRDRIVVQTIKGLYRDENQNWQYFVDEDSKIAYVRITSFSGETAQRLRSVLQDLQSQGMQGLILDLRDNSGGYLSAAVEIVDMFVSSGVIVSTRSARYPQVGNHDYATSRGTMEEFPMVVLVNGASASAAEIVSGALRDHNRALVVGTQTYGKGSVQQIQQFSSYNSEMKITIAYYYLPSGRRVNRDPRNKANLDYGVLPHVKLELTGQQRSESVRAMRDSGVLHRIVAADDGDWTLYTPEELRQVDPQLNLAAICLRAGVLADSLGADSVYVQRVGAQPNFVQQ